MTITHTLNEDQVAILEVEVAKHNDFLLSRLTKRR